MPKTEAILKEDVSVFDMVAEYGAIAVVVGVGLEVILAVVYRGNKPFFEAWGPVIANGLVAFGVIVEIIFSRWSREAQAELNRLSEEKVARTNERAANAERDTEKLRTATAWRSLTRSQHKKLVAALRANGPEASVRFSVLMNDQESLHFAQMLSIPFRAARWSVAYRHESYLHGIMTGLLLPEQRDNWLEETKVVQRRIREAFIAAEIPFVNGWPPEEPYMDIESGPGLSVPIAFVYVGPKPMPKL